MFRCKTLENLNHVNVNLTSHIDVGFHLPLYCFYDCNIFMMTNKFSNLDADICKICIVATVNISHSCLYKIFW